MREAVGKLDPAPDLLLNDAVTIPGVEIRQVPIIKGDAKSISIGAASLLLSAILSCENHPVSFIFSLPAR